MTTALAGKTYAADLGQLQVRITYESDTRMTFVVSSGAGLTTDGHTETVDVEIVEIRPQVYLVSWREASGATVVHVEDLERSVLHSTVTIDGQIYRMHGTMKEL